jgi:CRP-like cAMP-binding protein
MYELFFQKISEKVLLSQAQQDFIKSFLRPKKLRKRQYLLQEGDVAKNLCFVEKGLLRSYSVDEKGAEHIIQFALEGNTISDLDSFLTGKPSTYNIDAIEDCELVLISKSAHDEILKQIPEYEVYMRMQITGAYVAMQKRLTSIISLPVDERYSNFVKLFPNLVQRIPQHMIASYMGLTPETLSRIRGRTKHNQ